ncbi:Cutinase transcription factor 1 alpha [Golovinomyces cichoracearum]|uniref:Cutinase transcription factor 1 alpha n=1 Tax=Golovinomyces cichoracearum TaxID=62708 RepID=A0A420HAT4_9PEZI|nr:Cutinase transcription factor 1 alpha [Golovinomyces cichoracearum]
MTTDLPRSKVINLNQVRCDAARLGRPCTNCVAFSIECKIPTPKKKKISANKPKNVDNDLADGAQECLPRDPDTGGEAKILCEQDQTPQTKPTPSPTTVLPRSLRQEDEPNYTQFMKPKFTRAPIKDAGRVAYLGESSNLNLLVNDKHGTTDVVHYPLPEDVRGSRARLTDLDNVEIDILHRRGAFLLPPKILCDELVDSYFKWVAPIVPVINRNRFMRQYRNTENPPSLLLLQAVFLAGSRVCSNPQIMDAKGSTSPAALTFYKRAKALFEANYEDDRVTIVQALVLMGWYWEGPEDVTKNVFYWSRVATIVAQGSGMHRSVEKSQLSQADKRLWKRIWWTLFTRDRSVAVALGRPVNINTDDSDVEMVCESDFIEDENPEFPTEFLHVQFFLQYVKLCEIMGIVLSQQYSVASKARRHNSINLTHSDVALADWLRNCPKEIHWKTTKHQFWSALLHSNYYTTLCLLHRAHMPPASDNNIDSHEINNSYPSRNIAFQAATMITSIIENLSSHDELRFCPAFMVYSLFSALILHIYQMRSSLQSVVQVTQQRIRICMSALKEVSRVWLVAKMVYTLFESILGNKVLEERLQKAAGTRHRNMAEAATNGTYYVHQSAKTREVRPDGRGKRKYDDMALEFSVNCPAPQESYERSRPQTPSKITAREMTYGHIPLTVHQLASPNLPHNSDNLTSRNLQSQTRPHTPFNPFSVPDTPPDFYLVTRNSPNLSQSIWENFQPDHLFPEGSSNMCATRFSPESSDQNLDQSIFSSLEAPTTSNSFLHISHKAQSDGYRQPQDETAQPHLTLSEPQQSWQAGQKHSSQEDNNLSPRDSKSRISNPGPTVPMTMNVEDWYGTFSTIVLARNTDRLSGFSSSDLMVT